jgi:predicted RNA-binding protein associated with RNAse of E/G family
LGLRATVFHFNPGHEREQDYYLDVGQYTHGATAWHSEDHYLDLVVRTGIGTELTDVGELLNAVRYRLLSAAKAERAILHAFAAVEGLARHGHDLQRWLSANAIELTWRGS